MLQRKQRQQRKPPAHKPARSIGTAAERNAKDSGPKELMKEAAARAKKAGFCTGETCRDEEIRAWAGKRGRLLGGTLGAFAKTIAEKEQQRGQKPKRDYSYEWKRQAYSGGYKYCSKYKSVKPTKKISDAACKAQCRGCFGVTYYSGATYHSKDCYVSEDS